MEETNSSNRQTGKSGVQQAQASCPRSFRPWIWTLVLLALLTLIWVMYESYKDGGFVAGLFNGKGYGRMQKEDGKYSAGLYQSVNLPVVNTVQDSYHTIIEVVRPALVSIDVAVSAPDAEFQVVNPNTGGGISPVAGAPITYNRVGSGVIIDEKGFLITSYHVIEGASAMKATVYGPGGANDYPLKLVNIDKATDLALLRLAGNGPFPHAVLGDSDAVRTGDVVLAMGSPFGFDQTITTGIISSRNRTLTIGGKVFEGMLQTDTPINMGNSGGPLVNVRGEVIGINAAIYSSTGTFSGVGFAIPINHAASLVGGVVDFGGIPSQVAVGQLAAWTRMGRQTGNSYKLPSGRILNPPHQYRGKCLDCHPQLCTTPGQGGGMGFGRGGGLNPFPIAGQPAVVNDTYFGAYLLDVDTVIARQFNLAHAGGVLVDRVLPGTPADGVGIQRGDVILRLDGQRVQNVSEFQKMISAKKPGSAIELAILSNGSRKTVKVRFDNTQAMAPPFAPTPGPNVRQPAEFGWLGAEITPLTPAVQGYVKSGVYVAETGGVLAAAGLLNGDVIKSVNNHPVADLAAFIKMAKKLDVKKGFLLDVIRAGQPLYVTVKG